MKPPGDRQEPIEPSSTRSRIGRDYPVDGLANHCSDGHVPSIRLGAQPLHLVLGQGDLRPNHGSMLSHTHPMISPSDLASRQHRGPRAAHREVNEMTALRIFLDLEDRLGPRWWR